MSPSSRYDGPAVGMQPPVALLMAPQMMAAYFNAKGEQMPELQRLNWCGVRRFRELFPKASVELIIRSGGSWLLADDDLARLLQQLRVHPLRRPADVL